MLDGSPRAVFSAREGRRRNEGIEGGDAPEKGSTKASLGGGRGDVLRELYTNYVAIYATG